MSFPAYAVLGEGRYREAFGLDFEDLSPGQRFRHRPGVTLSQQDNTDESLDTMNAAMLHYDAHYAAGTMWKRPLMVSTITLQRAIGMSHKTFGRRRRIAAIDEIALVKPVFGGDTIYAWSEIIACQPSDNADTGLAKVRAHVVNETGVGVGAVTYDAEIWRRGRGPDGERTLAGEPRFSAWRLDPDGAYTEQVGLFYEDFVAGETFVHAPRRSFYWREAVEHTWRSLETSPEFHDLDWIGRHAGGRQRIPETFVVSTATALTTRTFGRVVANLGWKDVRLPNPVHAGDTIEVESTVIDKRLSRSRPDVGILTVATRARDQRETPVLSYTRNLLVYKRSADTPYAAAGY